MNSIIEKIKFEICSFQNMKRVQTTRKIEIDKTFQSYVIKHFQLNASRYKQSDDLVLAFNLKRFFKHYSNDFTFEINRLEFKLIKQKQTSIRKRVRTLSIKSRELFRISPPHKKY